MTRPPILAIDPGTSDSGYVVYDGSLRAFGIVMNETMVANIAHGLYRDCEHLAIEWVTSYGARVGETTFETVYWTGRICQAWSAEQGKPLTRIPRRTVKSHLCNTTQVKDSHIRAALIHKFGGEQQTKKGGCLHGVSTHVWAALAVAVTWWDRNVEE